MHLFNSKIYRYIVAIIFGTGLLFGVRFVASTIHYGCHADRITNIEDGDDCAPPIKVVGEIGFYLTGGSFNPVFNRDAITVRKVSWVIEDKVFADVTTYDGQTKRYNLGVSDGCVGSVISELKNKTIVIGRVVCDLGIKYIAFKSKNGFFIERYDEVSEGQSNAATLVEISTVNSALW
jgi:hypothetical protein